MHLKNNKSKIKGVNALFILENTFYRNRIKPRKKDVILLSPQSYVNKDKQDRWDRRQTIFTSEGLNKSELAK